MKEKDLQKLIIDYLRLKKIFHFRINSGAFKTEKGGFYKMVSVNGCPDIIAVVNGKFIGIEVKLKGRYQSPGQKEFQKNLEKSGGVYILAKSLDDVTMKNQAEKL